jgi:hypothetical protein
MTNIVKRAFPAITKHLKTLVWVLAPILLALALTFVLRKFPALRIPTFALAISIFLVVLLWLFPKWQVRSIVGLDSKDRFDSENEARKTLSQILGGLILLVGFYFTWQNLVLTRENQAEAEKATLENLRIASEGQITDRFTKAIAQLGDTRLEVWLGGIYALERIAKDSPKDHWTIMEVLTSYVREHAKVNSSKGPSRKNPSLKNEVQTLKPPRDIQAILTVLGRRDPSSEDTEKQWLDLHETDLIGAELSEAHFSKVDLRWANLSHADLTGADFSEADLTGAKLKSADLREADLPKTKLCDVDFTDARLNRAKLRGADFSRAVLRRADLSYADLTEAKGLLPAQLESAKGDALTKLPPGIPRPKSWQ